jgi:glycerol-3-phosphate acyltransferase PlsY
METLTVALIVAVCYLIGSIPFGLIVVKVVKGVDIRTLGSRNIGATNVGRVLGRKWGLLVFVLDFAKGFLPSFGVWALLVSSQAHQQGGTLTTQSQITLIGASLAVILGHIFPLYLRFRGGRGVATGAGVFSVLAPLPLAIAAAVWLLVVTVSRYVSFGSICAGIALPASFIALNFQTAFKEQKPLTILCLAVGAVVILRHIPNIKRLVRGTEGKIGKKHCLSAESAMSEGRK